MLTDVFQFSPLIHDVACGEYEVKRRDLAHKNVKYRNSSKKGCVKG
jgi:hypothetical protein